MKRLATPSWLIRHVVMIALVATFLKLGWWQLSRAEGGNGLSIGYTLEWPAFAAFVVIVWLREVRLTVRTTDGVDGPAAEDDATPHTATEMSGISAFDLNGARAERAARAWQTESAGEPDSDYNQYLAWLAAHPDAKPSDYRRTVNEGASVHE